MIFSGSMNTVGSAMRMGAEDPDMRRLARGRTNGKQLPRPFQGSSETRLSPEFKRQVTVLGYVHIPLAFILILLMYYLQDLVFSQELIH